MGLRALITRNCCIRSLPKRRRLRFSAAALNSLPGPETAATYGPVGARFLATLADAIAAEARAIAALGEDLASARSRTGVVADAYADADRRGSRLL